MSVWQLIYASSASQPLSNEAIADLLNQSRADNARHGITGLLVYHQGSFIQVLEGPEEKVEALYAKIGADTRHRQIKLLSRGEVASKEFPDWSMGFVDVLTAQRYADAFAPYNAELKDLTIDVTRAKKVLRMFREEPLREAVDH